MYIRTKYFRLKNKIGKYYYLVKSERRGKTVVQKVVKYLGKTIPKDYQSKGKIK